MSGSCPDARTHLSPFWLDLPVLVIGATRLVGGWLVRRLIEAGAEVTCLVRDWVPQAELLRNRAIDTVNVVHGDVCDLALMERALSENEIATVFHFSTELQVTVTELVQPILSLMAQTFFSTCATKRLTSSTASA